jgi:hypothetical protein
MKKQLVRLTESELHQIIEESVKAVIAEEMDEGMWDTAKSFFGQYGKRGANKAQEMGQTARQGMSNMANKVQQGLSNAANKVQQGITNVGNDIKQTYRNAQQDSQMKEMRNAFNNFKAAVEKFKAAGGEVNGQLASRIKGIENMMGKYQSHF